MASLHEELKQLQMKSEVTQENTAVETEQATNSEDASLVTSLQEELREAREKSTALDSLTTFQTETKETLQTLFPQIPIETEQPNWLQDFAQRAQEVTSHSQQSQESQTSAELPVLMGRQDLTSKPSVVERPIQKLVLLLESE